jgi:hypothetical protein
MSGDDTQQAPAAPPPRPAPDQLGPAGKGLGPLPPQRPQPDDLMNIQEGAARGDGE